MYYDPKMTWSYNAIYNQVYGNRGCGKTFGCLRFAMDKFIDTKARGEEPWQLIYVRRYREELKKLTKQNHGKLFDDVTDHGYYRGHHFKAEGNILYCDKEEFGMAIPLTDAPTLKSIPFPYARIGIFEEFVIDKGVRRYLPNEVECFLELDQTIDRDRDVFRWFMLGNLVNTVNPYMTYWGLELPYHKTRELHGNDNQILVEVVQNEDFIEKKKGTRRGKLISGTRYGDYAIENKPLRSNTHFIAKKSVNSEYKFTLFYMGHTIGVWFDHTNGRYVISNSVDKQCPFRFSTTTDNMEPNTMLLKGNRKSIFIKNIIDAYNNGYVYYETMKLKEWFMDIMRMAV